MFPRDPFTTMVRGTLVAVPTLERAVLDHCSFGRQPDEFPVTLLYGTGAQIAHLQVGDQVTFFGIAMGSSDQADWPRTTRSTCTRLEHSPGALLG